LVLVVIVPSQEKTKMHAADSNQYLIIGFSLKKHWGLCTPPLHQIDDDPSISLWAQEIR
jgi:hypothetical protein